MYLYELINILLEPKANNPLLVKDKNNYYLLEDFITDFQNAYAKSIIDNETDNKVKQIIELLVKIEKDTVLIPSYYNGIAIWKDNQGNEISDADTYFEKYINNSNDWNTLVNIAETVRIQET